MWRPTAASPVAVCRIESKAELSVRPAVGPSHFLLSGQEKVTKEKATPASRSPGFLPSEYASGLRGFSTAHPCTGEKHARIVRASLRAFPPAARRPAGAPRSGHPGRSPASNMHVRGTRPVNSPNSSARNSRCSCRATESAAGARRACPRPWMAALGCCAAAPSSRSDAPARGWRVAQGTALAKRALHEPRVAFLLPTSLWRDKEM